MVKHRLSPRPAARWLTPAALFISTFALDATAQVPVRAPANPPPVAPPATPAAPGTSTLGPTAQPGDDTRVLDSLKVEDPMLVPTPPAPKVLKTWQQALGMIRSQSTTLRTAYQEVTLAQERARLALASALPSLTGNAGITHHLLTGTGYDYMNPAGGTTSIPDPATTWQAGLNLRVPLFVPKTWYDHGTAKDATDVARLNIKDLERKVVAAAADAIVTSITAERLAEVSRSALASALSTLDLNKRRAALGASSAVDVLRAEQEVSLSRAQVVSANEAVQRSREALGLTLGTSDPWGVAPEVRLDGLTQEARNTCQVAPTIETRPDVVAARGRVKLAERQVGSAGQGFWPTVEATSNATYWSESDRSANGEHITWTVGGLLTWNLYDGGARYGSERVAQQEVELARLRLSDAERQARHEVVRAVRGVEVAEATLAVSRKTRDIAAESARLARVAFLHGSGTSFDLVDTAQKLRQADLDLAIKEFEVVRAKITALLAMAVCKV